MADLRASIFIDQLQPQTLAYISTWMRGYLPRLRMAAQIVEIAPGLDVEALTDTVLKSADVRAGLLDVERQFGTLQFHSHSTAEVHAGAAAILHALGKSNSDVSAPKILASKLVTNVDDQHAFLMKFGAGTPPWEPLGRAPGAQGRRPRYHGTALPGTQAPMRAF